MNGVTYRSRSFAGSARRETQFVSFRLDDRDFAVSVSDVYGIYHGLPIIPLPDSSNYVEGEVQLADARIPVLNLRRFMGLNGQARESAGHWIVMVNHYGGPVGLAVDGVTEVLQLPPNSFEEPDTSGDMPAADYLEAVARYHNKSVLVPDISRLIQDALA